MPSAENFTQSAKHQSSDIASSALSLHEDSVVSSHTLLLRNINTNNFSLIWNNETSFVRKRPFYQSTVAEWLHLSHSKRHFVPVQLHSNCFPASDWSMLTMWQKPFQVSFTVHVTAFQLLIGQCWPCDIEAILGLANVVNAFHCDKNTGTLWPIKAPFN